MYILSHDLDRQYQLQTARRIIQSDKKYIIINAPTGSGKTAYAAYAAYAGLKTIAVVRTKSLQRQYEQGYDFVPMFGKANYDCHQYGNQAELFDIGVDQTADLCTVTDEFKDLCRRNCPYWQDRYKFIGASAGILNYAKFLLDRRLIEDFSPDILFLDEAHELSESIVTGFSGTELKWTKRLLEYTDKIFIKKPQPIARKEGIEWLQSLYENLYYNPPKHPKKGGNVYAWKWHKLRIEQVDITLAALGIKPNVWWIDSDRYRFLAKPLTSEFHFKALFNKAPKIVLMSATIQKADIDALGLEPNEYEFIRVPNIIEPKDRPVYDLGGPAITAKSTLADLKSHIRLLSRPFDINPHYNGIIHVTSKKMASDIATGLSKILPNPIWIPDTENGHGTDKEYKKWQEFNARNESAICVAWQFFAGADMGDVAINITARVPYPYFGDIYEKERFNYHPRQALVRVANTMEQQQGRNRRGFIEHYGKMAKKFNAICDSKWTKLKSSMNKDFLRSIVKWTF